MPVVKTNKERQRPWDPSGDQEAVSFGTWLRRQREIREIPLREIADTTKISIRYLEALEQDRFDVLPAPVFAKGFLREYSKYVGVDPDEVVNSYLLAQKEGSEPGETAAEPLQRPDERKAPGVKLLGLGILAAIVVLGLVLYYAQFRAAKAPGSALPPIAAPVIPELPAATAALEAGTAPSPLVVTVDFTEDCWVEVEVDGERRLSELHVQGESMRLEAEDEVRLTLGNPAGVRLEVNGAPYDIAGSARAGGEIEINLETARTLAAGSP